jgi:NADPH2:quinone reductase
MQMRAIVCEKFASPEELVLRDIPIPEPTEDQVRIRVEAAGVIFPDALIVQGKYQVKPDLPFVPGSEVAGVIDAVGSGVSGLEVGERVMAIGYQGGFAAFTVAEANRTWRIPEGMTFGEAAGFVTNYATSYHALKQRGRIEAGDTILVLGAGGGVGITAVELAKIMGAKVIAAASSDEKLDLCRRHGADEFINYSTEDLRAGIARTTEGKGPDLIYDPVGGDLAEPAFRSIGWGGRYLVVGFAGGAIPRLPFNLPLIKGASIVGVICGIFAEKEPAAYQRNMEELLSMYGAGKLKPQVSAEYELKEAPAAIRQLLDRTAVGKLLIRMTPSLSDDESSSS